MNGRTRTLLAIALSTALIAPVAFAQQDNTRDTGNATSQAARDMPRPTLPPQAAPRAVDATTNVTQQRPTERTADAVDTRVPPATTLPTGKDQTTTDVTTTDATTMNKEIPPTAQGAAHAAAHSSVVQRDIWGRLDTDSDGLINATEADADTTFDGNFDAMDTDDNGFISDAEYRTFAKADKADVSQGAANAASHSSVVQRATWSRLDADADGRISATEADADATIDGSFSAIDSNSDGFITDAEFRAHAKATSKP
jgi:hypothetical protein